MKVLHVYKDYYPPVKGGIECHLNLLANGLQDRGVAVDVLVSSNSHRFETETYNGINVFKAPQLGRFYSAPITPTFQYYLTRLGKDADIIHFHHPNPTADFSYLFTDLNKKLVVTYHSDIIRQDKLGMLYAPFRTIFLTKADKIIATSPNYIKTSKVLRQFAHKCTVIPLGVDIARFTSNPELSKVSAIRKVHRDQPIILFVGCFRYYKGLHFLVSAMNSVPATLILIGAGPEEVRLRGLVDRKKLHGKVHFLGELSDAEVNAFYKACDIFVLPSHLRSEAFGIVQLEAMCCKKPVISTELGTGTTYVNIHQKTGIVIEPNDVGSLSGAINYLIDHPAKRVAFGASGYERVINNFSADNMVDQTLQLYQALIKPKTTEYYKKKKRSRKNKNNLINFPRSLNVDREPPSYPDPRDDTTLNPKVSIITVVKNCESTIEDTIQSIIRQSYPTIEHIIIDGASTDNTVAKIEKYRNHINAMRSEPDKGIYDAMNKGLGLATGDVIGFLNGDDIFANSGIIADVVNQIIRTGSDSVFGDLVYVSQRNPKKILRYYDSSGFNRKWLTMGAMPAHPTLYLKREIYQRFGDYKIDYRIAADFEFIERIFAHSETSYSYIPKVMVRMRTGGVSTRNLWSNWVLNKEMIRACRENDIPTNIIKILLKYPKKIRDIIKGRQVSIIE